MRTTKPAALAAPLLLMSAAFIAAGGAIHVREWLEVYRDIPSVIPGSAVVRVGFPVNAATSFAAAIALVVSALRPHRFVPVLVVAAIGFQITSLAVLILSRTGDVFGWMEPGWTTSANQTRAVEVGAVVSLAACLAILGVRPNNTPYGEPER